MPVLPHNALDSMAWAVAASGILLALAFWRLPYDGSKDTFTEARCSKSFGISFGMIGIYLFINGLILSPILWPLAPAGGIYNVLFGGISALAGLLLIGLAFAFYFNTGLRALSYFAVVVGLLGIIDVAGILSFRLTRAPELSAFAYLMFSLTAFLTVPLTHTNNKIARWLFIIVALIFGLVWMFEAANFTYGHITPPPPQ